MNQPIVVTVETLTNYSQKDATEIGVLLSHLSDSFNGSPVPEELLKTIIESPYHDQLVARGEDGEIIGAATMSIVMGAGAARTGWLEDFIVSPNSQGSGVGSLLWDAIIEWCKEKDIHRFDFTSRPSREAAQHFYVKRGAIVRDTNHFRKTID